MENLFGRGLSAYPSNWTPPPGIGEIELGSYVEVAEGSYAGLLGVVTYVEQDFAWVRLDGDAYDLRFRRDALHPRE
jgi:transcription antitermination factor NusG